MTGKQFVSIINVDQLGKKYIISRQGKEPYYALRDVMSGTAKRLGRRILHPLTSVPLKDSQEEFWALKDVSFEIEEGDRVGIIGRNGAGKSTLLKILSRITEPTRGRVTIRGRVASLLEVGTGFHPELTGRENVYLNGAILGMTKAEIKKKFDEIVAFAEVEKFLDTPVKRYSSGMYVRLAFAVAAHLEPEILIVDEVLAVGDAQFQKKCLGKMQDAGKDGKTVLFVSHNMSFVSELCDNGILLRAGQVAFTGPISETIDYYLKNVKEMSTALYSTNSVVKDRPYIESVWIAARDGQYVQQVKTGDCLLFNFKIANANRRLSLNFTICDMMGSKITNFNTLNTGDYDTKGEPGFFSCAVEELLLSEGTYLVNIALVHGGELIDHKISAIVFDVCAASLRGRKIGNSNYGTHTLMHHTWVLPE